LFVYGCYATFLSYRVTPKNIATGYTSALRLCPLR